LSRQDARITPSLSAKRPTIASSSEFAFISATSSRRLTAISWATGGFSLDHEKLLGYTDALALAGVSVRDAPIVEAHPLSPWVNAGARMLLDRSPEATAVLAMSDRHAVAVWVEAKRRQINVPKDLSVIGFDDAENAILVDPLLTTMAQPTAEKGRIAARILFEDGPPRQIVLPARLIARASTAPPRRPTRSHGADQCRPLSTIDVGWQVSAFAAFTGAIRNVGFTSSAGDIRSVAMNIRKDRKAIRGPRDTSTVESLHAPQKRAQRKRMAPGLKLCQKT
jgi:hypothetical protein